MKKTHITLSIILVVVLIASFGTLTYNLGQTQIEDALIEEFDREAVELTAKVDRTIAKIEILKANLAETDLYKVGYAAGYHKATEDLDHAFNGHPEVAPE